MTRNFIITGMTDEEVLPQAVWQLSCIELSSGRPKRFPPEFVELYLPFVNGSR